MKHITLLCAGLLLGVSASAQTPTTAAPTPTANASDVISMFSDAYTDVPVDTWLTPWSNGMLNDIMVAGNATKEYTALDFVGVEAVATQIDASAMDTFHVDMWTPNLTEFRIKLVDFGPNGAFDGPGMGDDTEHEVVFPSPAMNSWVSLAIPMSDFAGLTNRANIAQLIFSGNPTAMGTVYIDNVYFQDGIATPPAPVPTVAAPTPTDPAANVISMYSDAYTDVAVDTWLTVWSNGSLLDTAIAGNATKRYSALDFVGVEAVMTPIDASAMNTFHFDIWTPNMTELRVKLVDFGPNGVFDGPGMGDDSEHEVVYPTPAQTSWVEFDIPLTDFAGLTATSNLAQFIFAGNPAGSGILYIDNVYFSDQSTNPNVPAVAAPTPTIPAAQVISMFSDAYTDVPVDTWQTSWSSGTLTDIMIAGNPTKRYDNVDFVGVETVASQINASAMDTFHVDMWTPNMTEFRVKLVDFGANGVFDGPGMGDDVEHEVVISNPTPSVWNSLAIPMADFTGLTTSSNIAQLVFSGNPAGSGTLFIDNVFFSEDGPSSISENGLEGFDLFPNPAKDELSIISEEQVIQVNVMDMSGKLVLNAQPMEMNPTLDISALVSGAYLVLVQSNESVVTRRLVVE